jgi:site-specific recombinase XerD
MSRLRQALADYLQIRRALGYKLERAGKLLLQYLDYLDALGAEKVTIENAVAWARLPAAGKNGHWWAFRLSAVRGLARYLHGLDDTHEVPPADLLPNRVHRSIPYLYSQEEILALMAATGALGFGLRQATYRTLIELLAVTGMRVGEAIRLDRQDLDLRHGILTLRGTKFGKSRELPLHDSTVDVLCCYSRLRDRFCPEPVTDAVLICRRDEAALQQPARDLPRASPPGRSSAALGGMPSEDPRRSRYLRGAHAARLVPCGR